MSATSVVPTASEGGSGARTLWEPIASTVERYGDGPALGCAIPRCRDALELPGVWTAGRIGCREILPRRASSRAIA